MPATASNVVEDQVIQTPRLAPKAGEAGLEAGLGYDMSGSFDFKAFIWYFNTADASGATDVNRE